MFSISVSLALCKPITGTGWAREDFVNNELSIAEEDIVWVEAQNHCSAPIFIQCVDEYFSQIQIQTQMLRVWVSAPYLLFRQSHLRCTL